MATFNFPMHQQETKYPVSGFNVKLGKSYTFTAAPDAPDQRTFILSFTGFKYYTDANEVVEAVTNASMNNMAALEAFYNEHKLWKTFAYTHPVYGLLDVKFSKPLHVPKGQKGGSGVLQDFSIEFEEQP
jgi:phage-related protein